MLRAILIFLLWFSVSTEAAPCWQRILFSAWPWGHPALIPYQHRLRQWIGRTKPPTLSHSYRRGYCFFATRELGISLVQFPDVRIDDVSVLFITQATGWTVHVVLYYQGFVYDPSEGGLVTPEPVRVYFERVIAKAPDFTLARAEVRIIPFSLFRQFGQTYSPGHFVAGLKDPGYRAEPDAFSADRFPTSDVRQFFEVLTENENGEAP